MDGSSDQRSQSFDADQIALEKLINVVGHRLNQFWLNSHHYLMPRDRQSQHKPDQQYLDGGTISGVLRPDHN